jgi:hypothetical protein
MALAITGEARLAEKDTNTHRSEAPLQIERPIR